MFGLDESEVKDNRFLRDDGKSQKLTKDDIEVLKTQGLTGKVVITLKKKEY